MQETTLTAGVCCGRDRATDGAAALFCTGMLEVLSTAYDVIEVVLPIVMIPVVTRQHGPYVSIAWLVLITFLPIAGTLGFVYFGWFRIHRDRELYARVTELLEPMRKDIAAQAGDDRDGTGGFGRLAREMASPGNRSLPALTGNRVELLVDGDTLIDRLVEAIGESRKSVHLLYYMYAPDGAGRRVARALVEAASRGVRCRLLAGAYSSTFEVRRSFFRTLARELREAGVEVLPLRPLNPIQGGLSRLDLQNHRKLAVIDGRVAFTGSQNVHDPDHGLEHGIWHQMNVRVEGPAALQLQTIFLEDWYSQCGELLSGPDVLPEAERREGLRVQVVSSTQLGELAPFLKLVLGAIHDAGRRVILTSPYTVPEDPLKLALGVAALRGIEVDLVVPERSDKPYVDAAARSAFEPLLRQGVRIHRHSGGVLHAKSISVDDRYALVGSANLDPRSFYLDAEVGVVVFDEAFAKEVRAAQERWIGDSRRLTSEELARRTRVQRSLDDAAKLLTPFL